MDNFFKVSFLWILLTLCLYITLPAHAENDCGISIPTEAGNLSCEGSTITWDDAGSADIIDRNSSCAVAITDDLGKGGPYVWSVSGTGFALDYAQTAGLTNTLTAWGTACGSATITVTGCNGTVVTGYVRCMTGSWVLQAKSFNWPYSTPVADGTIIGKYKIVAGGFAEVTAIHGGWYSSEALCVAGFLSSENYGDGLCSTVQEYVLGCLERISGFTCAVGFAFPPNWHKCIQLCYSLGPISWRFDITWLQDRSRVWLWGC